MSPSMTGTHQRGLGLGALDRAAGAGRDIPGYRPDIEAEGTDVRLPVGRLRPATLGVFVVLVAAGLLFAVSAVTARGTQLRSDRSDAVALARSEQARYAEQLAQLKALRREV